MSNVKPGDIAFVVRDQRPGSPCLGRIVEVLYAPPVGRFTLPDGYHHQKIKHDQLYWVIRFVGGPVVAPCLYGTRDTFYGVGPDSALRPINGSDITEETPTEIQAKVAA